MILQDGLVFNLIKFFISAQMFLFNKNHLTIEVGV